MTNEHEHALIDVGVGVALTGSTCILIVALLLKFSSTAVF